MARQRIHNSRAGHTTNSGASWISYSDMMAALLLVFVLILCTSLYQYFQMLEVKTKELDDQKALVSAQQQTLDEQTLQLVTQQEELDKQSAQVIIIQSELEAQKSELENTRIILLDKEQALEDANTVLAEKEAQLIILQQDLANKENALNAATQVLEAQRLAMTEQINKMDTVVGMRTRIIEDLSVALKANNLSASVDKDTGAIVLDSAVLFKTNSSKLQDDGYVLLDRFIPVYLSVLLQPEYEDYLAEIIIEGHTDSTGDYMSNLKLSMDRSYSVAEYVLNMPHITGEQRALLQKILISTGRSESDPVLNAGGYEDLDASRRVEFKFRLKDAEMFEEMNLLLQQSQ
ncbi:MAG: hypothetical protein E7333_00010 [Clostridiales bacterium]|nr:hypothetical protein [Clostridiales bacterium]